MIAEQHHDERRVALTPSGIAKLLAGASDQELTIQVEAGAGNAAGFDDEDYRQAGAEVVDRATAVGDRATGGIVVGVHGPGPETLTSSEWSQLGAQHIVVGLHDPLSHPERADALAATGATALSLELIPRITRAQSMDVLSSMATVTGYQAVLLAASRLPHLLPMLMTAAGTVPPAKFLILGAGVAGLQAIATARRLGAVVEAYDVRPAAQEQIESLGARSIQLDLDTAASEGAGGYATEQSEDQNRRQLELLAPYVIDADAVITTAAVPGAISPELITAEMVDAMKNGSVIVDLAAERGGNCRLTQANGEVTHSGVLLLGPTDLASQSAATASQLFSGNVVTLLLHLLGGEGDVLDFNDEITDAIALTHGGDVRPDRVRERLGLSPLHQPTQATTGGDPSSEQDSEPEGGNDS